MYKWEINDSTDVMRFLDDFFRIVDDSQYRSFRVDVDLAKDSDVGVYVQSINKFSFDIFDVGEAENLIIDQINFGVENRFDVHVFMVECGDIN